MVVALADTRHHDLPLRLSGDTWQVVGEFPAAVCDLAVLP